MKYAVVWLPDAEQELTAIWLAARDRQAVTEAAHAIDTRLGIGAEADGESRSGDQRILFSPPLVVRYRVVPGTQDVQVFHVRRY
jgi:hypothetical protein